MNREKERKNGASDGPADRQRETGAETPFRLSPAPQGLTPRLTPKHQAPAPPRGPEARAPGRARRADTHPPAAAREWQRHPPSSSYPHGRRLGKGRDARAGSVPALSPSGLVVLRISRVPSGRLKRDSSETTTSGDSDVAGRDWQLPNHSIWQVGV